ncbi:hypothetical protein [Streptomyces lanatus]|uniref:Uncharacterized protein n=1 Tax=Streptomyces lanatus TaxID=66900 RepID=A0ABV1Y0G1_9ACTN|nr:hypothetical protein [Streptomyces lanatus]GHH22509.1 hypothetical protein GCM10018780_71050 [Streptomyces lanatus]
MHDVDLDGFRLEEQWFDDEFEILRGRRQPVDRWSDLLFQATWWQDADAARTIWRLDELSEQQCALIHRFVAMHEEETGTLLAWESTHAPVPSGDVAFDAYDRGQSQLLEMVSEHGWIHRTDLMLALQRRMRGWPAVEGTCFCGYPVTEGWTTLRATPGWKLPDRTGDASAELIFEALVWRHP